MSVICVTTDIRLAAYLKSWAASVLKQINKAQQPVNITQNGKPNAVLQGQNSMENISNANGILELISLGEEDIRMGRVLPQDKVFAHFEAKLTNK